MKVSRKDVRGTGSLGPKWLLGMRYVFDVGPNKHQTHFQWHFTYSLIDVSILFVGGRIASCANCTFNLKFTNVSN